MCQKSKRTHQTKHKRKTKHSDSSSTEPSRGKVVKSSTGTSSMHGIQLSGNTVSSSDSTTPYEHHSNTGKSSKRKSFVLRTDSDEALLRMKESKRKK